MPIAMTPEQLALQASLRDWAKRAGPLAIVRSMELVGPGEPAGPGGPAAAAEAWAAPLAELAALGVFAIQQEGGTVTDLAAALEQLARDLAPGPILPTALAGLLLASAQLPPREAEPRPREAAEPPASEATKLLAALAQAQTTAAVALSAGTLTGTGQPDGALRVTGETGPLLWAPGHLLAPARTDQGDAWFLIGPDPQSQPGMTISMLKPLDFSRELATVRLDDVLIPPQRQLPGLDTARVTDLAATLYAAEAARLAAWCCDTAADYAKTRIQFGRPIGSFQAVKHICAAMACRAERAAALAWDAARAADEAPREHPLAAAAAATMALEDAVGNAKDCIQVLGGIGFTWEHDAHLYLRRALALRQLLGGSHRWRARAAELAAAGDVRRLQAPDDGAEPSPYPGIGAWAGPAIAAHGTPDQQERFLGPTQRAEITWCQLFSEPEAGSDLASLRTKAVPDGAVGWRLTGQKVWTSLARDADWAICLARTEPAVPKHQGITFFLVDMHAPGIDIRPLREITGRAVFNEVFLDDVAVPGDCVLGAPGDGWRIAMSTLATERMAMGGGPALDEAVARLLAAGGAANPIFAERTGVHVASALTVALLDLRCAHPAIRKLVGTEHRQSVAETALELLGPAGAADTGAASEFLLTRCLSIAGGTTQILLNQVAERVLGLPREPR